MLQFTRWWYDTWNHYINITIFSWLSRYRITGQGSSMDYGNNSGYWKLPRMVKFTNQDRSFRLRVWKEGWVETMDALAVIGANDAIGDSANGGFPIQSAESRL